jgi:asparagine synthase (glutamine-hydrolysing)
MSAQFGRWNFDGVPSDSGYLTRVSRLLAPYGPNGVGSYSKGGVSIFHHAFHTTAESRKERQPQVSASGIVLAWDGRLDNREDLIGESSGVLPNDASDVSIVAAAYERRGTHSFANLVGDWAVSIWNPDDRSLILAKDPIGTLHLYYTLDNNQLTWCTVLDPLVLLAGKQFALDEAYLAGWISSLPAGERTPYVGIHSVPASCFVHIRPGGQTIHKYWDFDPDRRIRYRTDAEYEEHFRAVFAESVRRRLRSDAPVLAELSGGMDSSSIVCVADTLIARGLAECPRLDTVSYYSDAEPNWNERPYFTKVEEQRGRTGCHIDLASGDTFKLDFDKVVFTATPGSDSRQNSATREFAACMISQGNRVVLSGTGGDEVMGGVPTPAPELADLLARGHFDELVSKLKTWALDKRMPWIHLLWETLSDFLPPGLVEVPKRNAVVPWLHPNLIDLHRAGFAARQARLRLIGPLPSFQGYLGTLERLRSNFACGALPSQPSYEKRYPYLDRNLLEFMYAVPREQLVRPGQRRSLMRRSLRAIVPPEVLNRKRKAFVVRAPMAAISEDSAKLTEISQNMVSGSLGIIEPRQFREAIQNALRGIEVPVVILLRTLSLELWLRAITRRGILRGFGSTGQPSRFPENAEQILAGQGSAK